VGNKSVKLYDGSMHQWTLEKRPTVTVSLGK
jgi:thiosulfate/3-mercaptopyruvate sulfurtransferase